VKDAVDPDDEPNRQAGKIGEVRRLAPAARNFRPARFLLRRRFHARRSVADLSDYLESRGFRVMRVYASETDKALDDVIESIWVEIAGGRLPTL